MPTPLQCSTFLQENIDDVALAIAAALRVTPKAFDEHEYRFLKKMVVRRLLVDRIPDLTISEWFASDLLWQGAVRIMIRTMKKLGTSVILKNRDSTRDTDQFFDFDIVLVVQEAPFEVGIVRMDNVPPEYIVHDGKQYFGEFDGHYDAVYEIHDITTDDYRQQGDEIFQHHLVAMEDGLVEAALSYVD